jgi:hypothetical protein
VKRCPELPASSGELIGPREAVQSPPPPLQVPSRSGRPNALPFPLLAWSPLRLGLLATLAAACFCALRILVAGHGNPGSFVVAGTEHVRLTHYTSSLPVTRGSGYDGQFYYRLALSPADWARNAFGINLDNLGRLDRVTYPALVWLASAGGQVAAVPAMMVAVNVAAFGALAGLGAALAEEVGEHPLWGFLPASFFGFLWSASRDLTELTEATLVVAGLLLLRKRQPAAAGVVFSAAALAKESALVVAGAVFLARAWGIARGRERPGAADAAWLFPGAAFLGWQLLLKAGTGTFPALGAGGANMGPPFAGLVGGAGHYIGRLPQVASLLWVSEAAVLLAVALGATISLAGTTAALHERIAWAGSMFLAVVLAKAIWLGDVGFRSLDDLWLFSSVLLLCSRSQQLARLLAALFAAAAWCVVALELVLFI